MRKKHVTMEAEIGMMRPQATEHLKSPEAGRSKEQNLPWSLGREGGHADTLIPDFQLPEPQDKVLLS